MGVNGALRFCLVGSADLTVQCAQAIQAAGHDVVLLVSEQHRAADWAADCGVPVLGSFGELDPAAPEADFDHLLSVVNGRVLGPEALALPRRCAINYHDAPLPRYAGVHATSWAILDGARTHGITWHVMAEQVDAGDILVQRRLPIEPGDSAYDLNVRCHEAALASFGELLDGLAGGRLERRAQNLAERTYFGATRREPHGGLISWTMEAEEIDRIVRAHALGPVINTFGTAKLWLNGHGWIVPELSLLPDRSAAPAGTVLSVGEADVVMTTATRDVRLVTLLDPYGTEHAAAEVVRDAGLESRVRWPELPEEAGDRLTRAARTERRCLRALERAVHAFPPVATSSGGLDDESFDLDLREAANQIPEADFPVAVTAAVLGYLARGGAGPTSAAWSSPGTRDRTGGLEPFFAPDIPITEAFPEGAATTDVLAEVSREITDAERRGAAMRDLPYRYRMPVPPPLPVGIVAGDADPGDLPPRALTVVIGSARRVRLISNPGGYDRPALERIAAGLRGQLRALQTDSADEWELGPPAEGGAGDFIRLLAARLSGEGERTALVHGATALTYRELDRRCAGLARRLRQAGVGPETPVAVMAAASAELLVACLAILRVGGLYVPVDPRWPTGRIAAVLADAAPEVVLTAADAEPEWAGPTIAIAGAVPCDGEPWSATSPGQAAYVMYTSGSTGTPKGVVGTLGGLANRMLWWQHAHPLTTDDVLLQSAAAGFDISLWELLAGLLAGAQTVISEHHWHGIVPYLGDLLSERRVTVAHLVPSVLEQLVAGRAPDAGLRMLITGGEAVSPALRDRCAEWTGAEVIQAYGPTEASISVLHGPCRAKDPVEAVPLGVPLSDTGVAVVGEDGRRVPVGMPGELVIAGTALARGYYKRPRETAEHFRPDGLGLDPAGCGRVYHTGDRARYRPDGRIEFLGRIDDQVKIHGHRIDPAQIEALLQAAPGVSRAVVLPVTDDAGRAALAAFVTGEGTDISRLRGLLSAHLPQPVIPTRWVRLDGFPLTSTGKVDRRALRRRAAAAAPAPAGAGAEPRTELERDLCGLWAELFHLSQVHADDDFFAVGGHSLIATRIIAAVWERYGVRVGFGDVMGAGTVAGLARIIEARPDGAQPIETRPDDGSLTNGQLRVLFEEEFLGGPGVFNVPVTTRLRGQVDAEALRSALNALARRHPMLRASIEQDGDRPRLRIAGKVTVPFEYRDEEGRLEDELTAMLAEPFDLTAPPLLRARLIRIAADEHVFALVLHHLIVDRWSMRLLFGDLRELYAAIIEGDPVTVRDSTPAPHERMPPEPVIERDLGYWTRRLSGVSFAGDLRVGRRRPDSGHLAGSVRTTLGPQRTERLRALCVQRGVTPFMVLLTVFQVLLHRFSDSDDVVVGTPVANRADPETSALVGMLMNTVPLHADLGGAPGFADVLGRNRQSTLDALEHQNVPLDRLTRALGLHRRAGHHPLMRYLMVWEDSAGVVADLPGVTAEAMTPPVRITAFDLSLIARSQGTDLGLELEFKRGVFDEEAARSLAGSFTRLLSGFLDGPARFIGSVPLAAHTALPPRPDGPAPPVITLVEKAVRARPDAVCVVDGSVTTTYAELDGYAAAVAARLRAAGVRPGMVVGVCLPRSARLVGALLGVLKAGGGFLPMDPHDPAERLRRQYEMCGGAAVVTSADLAGRFAETDCVVVDALERPLERAGVSEAPMTVPPDPRHPAYVIFTSGSTGAPKGVTVENGSLADHVRWAMDEFELTSADRVLQFSAPTFDVMLEEVFPALCAGATLVLRAPGTSESVEHFVTEAVQTGLTVANLPTGYWAELTAALADGDLTLPPDVRLYVIGGEQVPADALRQWHAHARDGVRLINAYGPTETTIGVTAADLSTAAAEVSIGTPVPGARVHVLDRYLLPVPDGVVGELYIGGTGVGRGYVGRADLTAERFVPDLLAPGARMFRTGDLGYRRAGRLYFAGRADRQVKVRGFRIEPEEIESVLAGHPRVRRAAVLVDPSGGSRLVAFVVPAAPLTSDEVTGYLAGLLPKFMVPSVVRIRPDIPETAGGKLDRNALGVERVPDRDRLLPYERPVSELWAAMLGVAEVDGEDDFFALGGHSLLAMSLVRRMRPLGYPRLSVSGLYENPTIAGLRSFRTTGTPEDVPAPGAAPRTAPLSWSQLGIWVRSAVTPTAAYNMPLVVRLRGRLDEDALRAALKRLAERHDLLRSVVVPAGEEPVLRAHDLVGDEAGLPLDVVDPAGPVGKEIDRLVAEPFDLSRSLVRATLVRADPDVHVLVLVIHHIAADGWSARLVLGELAALYASQGSPPPPARSFLAYAAAERSAAPDEARLEYWRRVLDGAPERLDLPASGVPGESGTDRRHTCVQALPGETVERLRRLARENHTTIFVVLLAITQVWLARCCRQDDVVVGTPVATRDPAGHHDIVGPLVTMVPVRAQVDPRTSFVRQLATVRSVVLGALAHRDVPAQRIAELAPGTARPGEPRALHQVVFDIDEPDEHLVDGFATGGLAAEIVSTRPAGGLFDLEVTARLDGAAAAFEVRGSADLFGAQALGHLATALGTLAEATAADPGSPIGDLDLVGAEERDQILGGFATTVLPPSGVHELVTATLSAHPDATAVTMNGAELTCRELDDLSARVATHLIGQGLPAEGRVAVHLGRSPELPAIILGIWWAGGVFVPLDPRQPAARLAQIVADCRPAQVIGDVPGAGLGVPATPVAEIISGPADLPGPRPADGDRLAYITYTSGSTGRPKGVQCTHRGLVNQLLWAQTRYPVGPGDTLLQLASVGFDIALWEIFHPLIGGGRLAVLPEERHGDVPAIAELIAAANVTVVHMVPSLLEGYLEDPQAGAAPALRDVVCGGERMAPGLARRFAARMSATLHHTYGPTEASIIVTHQRCSGELRPPLGLPVPNARIYILDPADRHVPVGVVGELHIAGPLLARGYLGRPGLTADRFVPDPYAAAPGGRMYRTGDLARRGPDGLLGFVGRADRQVKQGGVRIEPAEVETVLAGHPDVSACVVVPQESAPGRPVLVGYIVPAPGVADAAGLCARAGRFMRDRLPPSMVPAALVPMAALPLQVNGKLDVTALPLPERWGGDRDARPPRTEAERRLAAIWSAVLPVTGIGAEDNFFDVGGDSVSAIRVVSRARAAGLRLTLAQVLRTASLAELAAQAVPAVEPLDEPDLEPASDELWPSPAQAAFLAEKRARPQHFNQACLVEPREPLDPGALAAALQAVAAHHEALRLRVLPATGLALAPPDSPPDRLARLVIAPGPLGPDLTEAARSLHEGMDLQNGPTFGALLGDRPDGSPLLLLAAHHLAVDTASWDQILTDLAEAYRSAVRAEPIRLTPPDTPFSTLARRFPALANSKGVRAQEPYWLDQLALTGELPRDEDPAPAAGPVSTALGTDLLAVLGRHRLSVEDVLLTAIAQTLAAWTGRREVAFLREGHGRDGLPGGLDVTRTVGWLTSVHPLRLELPPGDDPLSCLRAVKEQLRAVPEGGVGYGLLRHHGDGARLGGLPEPEIVLNYLGSTAAGGDGLLARAEVQELGEYAAPEDGPNPALEIVAGLGRDGLSAEWHHGGGRYAPATIQRLAAELERRLSALLAALEDPVAVAAIPHDYPLAGLPGEQLRTVLAATPGAQDVLPLSPALHGMLAWQLAHPASGAYHTQMVLKVEGEVDEQALRVAWRRVGDHYAIFRTAFRHDGLDEPVQVVLKPGTVQPDWRRHRDISLDDLLQADLAEPFKLTEPRLSRLHWLAGGARGTWLVWSHHHILLDGWSLPLVLGAVAECYEAELAGVSWDPPADPGYAAYLRWLAGRDRGAAHDYWRRTLGSVTGIVRLARSSAAGPGERRTVPGALTERDTARLTRVAERNRVTLNSVLLAAWSVLLRQRSTEGEVVFGTVMSLRPDEIPGVERLVGPCLSTVPIRVPITAEMDLPALFDSVQQRLVAAYEHAAHPPGRLPFGTLDGIVVFENYPGDRTGVALGDRGRLRAVRTLEPTEFPVALTISPGEGLTFELTFADAGLDHESAAGLLHRFTRLLQRIAADSWKEEG